MSDNTSINYLKTSSIAKMLQVSAPTVISWCDRLPSMGGLKCQRYTTGGPRLINPVDLKAFLSDKGLDIPHVMEQIEKMITPANSTPSQKVKDLSKKLDGYLVQYGVSDNLNGPPIDLGDSHAALTIISVSRNLLDALKEAGIC
jgi:hypothetical protein